MSPPDTSLDSVSAHVAPGKSEARSALTVRWTTPPDGGSRSHVAWAYARHELLYICWALMDVALIGPVALVFMPWTYLWPFEAFIIWLLLILLVPFNLSRLMSIADVDVVRQRRTNLLAFAVVLFIALRGLLYEPRSILDFSWLVDLLGHFLNLPGALWQRDLALFSLVAALWWRGLALAGRHVAVDDVGFRMRLGGLLLAPLLIALSLVPAAGNAITFVILFFLAALMAVALTRAEEVAREHSGASYSMSPRWVTSVFLTSLFVVGVAALIGLGLSGRGWQQLLQWLSPLWDALALGGMVVVTTATYLLLFLLAPLQWLLRYFFQILGGLGIENLPEPEVLTPELADQNIDQLLLELGESPSVILQWLNRGAVVLFVLVVLLILYLALRRYFYQRNVTFGVDETGQPTQVAGAEQSGLGHRILDRFARWRRWRVAATVRQLYRSMCKEAAERGFPRTLSETPYEYLETLSEVWPLFGNDVQLITDAYVRVRYGEVPESGEELDEIRDAWKRLERAERPE